MGVRQNFCSKTNKTTSFVVGGGVLLVCFLAELCLFGLFDE